VENKAVKAIEKKLDNALPQEDKTQAAVNDLKEQVDDLAGTLVGIKEKKLHYNPSLMRNNLKGRLMTAFRSMDQAGVDAVFDYIKEVQNKAGVTVFAANNAIWKFKVPVKAAAKESTSTSEFEGVEIIENTESDRLQLVFDGRPTAEMMTDMKKSGWHWSPSNKAWQRKLTDNAMRSARVLLAKHYKKAEAAKEEATETSSMDIEDRDAKSVADQKVKAYYVEHPELKSLIEEELRAIGAEADASFKGERVWQEDADLYGKGPVNSGGVAGLKVTGFKMHASDSIRAILDTARTFTPKGTVKKNGKKTREDKWESSQYTFKDISNAINSMLAGDQNIINKAIGKRIELIAHENLMKGVNRDDTIFSPNERRQEANIEYQQLIYDIQAKEQNLPARDLAEEKRIAEEDDDEMGLPLDFRDMGEDVQEEVTRIVKDINDLKTEIIEANEGRVTEEQADALVYLIDSVASYSKMTTQQYINEKITGFEKSKLSDLVKNQKEEAGKVFTAATTFSAEDNKAIIHALKSSDLTSMTHELGHVFRRSLNHNDRKLAELFSGVENGNWTIEAEEKFANAFTKYLSTGKAPTAKLKVLFDKFKQWIGDIYSKVRPEYKKKLDSSITGVFDRMVKGRDIVEKAPTKESVIGEESTGYIGITEVKKEQLYTAIKKYGLINPGAIKMSIDAQIMSKKVFESNHKGQSYEEFKTLMDNVPEDERSSIRSDVLLFSEYDIEGFEEYENTKDMWFANKDFIKFQNMIDAGERQTRIKESVGEKHYGKKSRMIDQAINIYVDLKDAMLTPGAKLISHAQEMINKYYDQLTEGQQRIVDLSQNLTAAQKQIAEEIIAINARMGLEALDEGVIRNVRENYIARFWQQKDADAERFRKFGVKTGHARHRVFESVLEGWANGFTLSVTGATNATKAMQDILAEVIENKRLVDTLTHLDNPQNTGFKLLTTYKIEGYEQIEHPNFQKWEYAGTIEKYKKKPRGRNFIVTDDGTVLERRVLYAPDTIARNLNRILGVSALNKYAAIRVITKYNAIAKATILITSLFHHVAYMNSYWFGTHGIKLKDMNPIAAYKKGLEYAKSGAV
jgi:hypothetical protein